MAKVKATQTTKVVKGGNGPDSTTVTGALWSITNGMLVLSMPIHENPRLTSTGKALILAEAASGNQPDLLVSEDGAKLGRLRFAAYVYLSPEVATPDMAARKLDTAARRAEERAAIARQKADAARK